MFVVFILKVSLLCNYCYFHFTVVDTVHRTIHRSRTKAHAFKSYVCVHSAPNCVSKISPCLSMFCPFPRHLLSLSSWVFTSVGISDCLLFTLFSGSSTSGHFKVVFILVAFHWHQLLPTTDTDLQKNTSHPYIHHARPGSKGACDMLRIGEGDKRHVVFYIQPSLDRLYK